MHKNGISLQIIWCEKMDGRKINKRGGSNKGMADGFFLQNKYPWRHRNSIAESKFKVVVGIICKTK